MHKILQAGLLLLLPHAVSAQLSLKGKVSNENKEPVELAIVSIKKGNVIIGNTITDSLGHYQFPDLKNGAYTISVKNIAFKDTTFLAVVDANTLPDISLRRIGDLKEVVVTAKKPVFQREIDRLRFNVGETDLVFGNNIWDVIEKTPLVNVSSDGTIQISGTSGAIVYINNKRKVLSGNALKNYLSSIPSDNLDAIEVITTPPSKYDAEGGAGIINILTKKNKEEGLVGNTVLSSRQTAVNSQGASVYLNNRQGKWNVYSDFSMGNRSRQPEFKKDIYYPASGTKSLLHRNITSNTDFQNLYPGANLGIDREINENHVVGLLFDYGGSWHKETRDAFRRDYYPDTDSLSKTNNRDNLSSQTFSLNLNYQGKLDSSGKKISIDFDALEYTAKNNSVSKTNALDLSTQQPLFTEDWFRSASPQKISNQSVKVDFEWPVNKRVGVEFGSKLSFSNIDNTLLFENRNGDDNWVKDLSRSNLFRYQENINSLYGLIKHKVSAKWSYQLGLRLENTVATGWLEGIKEVDRNYVNVFPTAFLKYTTSQNRSFVLALSSRITRPGYWDVNPFRTYTTDQTYFEGNPFLSPSKYYRQELNHTFSSQNGTFSVQFAAGQLLDEFYALPYNPSGNIIANKKVNYGNKYSYSNTITYYNQILPWWKFTGTTLTGYVVSKGKYANDVIIDNKTMLLSISTNQTFTLSKKESLFCTVIANNTFPVTIVNTAIGNRLETEIRLRKSSGPWNITLSAQDLLKSNKDRYKVLLNELSIVDMNYYDTRSAALSVSYSFGKSSVKSKRDRDAGYEAIKQRLS